MIRLAHGAAGGWDELFLVAAVSLLAFGIVRMLDANKPWERRWLGAIAIAVSVAVGAAPFVLGLGRVKPAKIRPVSTAQVAIVQPPAGGTIHGPTLAIVLRLEGGRIVGTATNRLRPDEGHIHVLIDGKLQAMTGLIGTIDIGRLSGGPHTLRAEFVAGDHAPFANPVASEIAFERG